MQNRYTGDIGDYLKLGILRALAPGYQIGVAWWLYPDQNNGDGRHISYLNHPERWRYLDPDLFDALKEVVYLGRRHVGALEAANILPGAIFANESAPIGGPVHRRLESRQEWFGRMKQRVADADLLFVDPDNGLEPAGFKPGSAEARKSIMLAEILELRRTGRCLIVYHHQTRRAGGHSAEIEHWADRLREAGFTRVDALRAKPFSPRVFFLLDAPDDVRHRAEQVAERWRGLMSWHSQVSREEVASARSTHRNAAIEVPYHRQPVSATTGYSGAIMPPTASKARRGQTGATTQVGYVNRNRQEVVRPTGRLGTDHGQYVYVLRCRTCSHEYGANGSDIWLRRCPAHDDGAPGLAIET